MLAPKLDLIVGLSLRCACVLALAATACRSLQAERAMLTGGVQIPPPRGLAEIDTGCWNAASLAIIDAKKVRAADSVAELWDLMTHLRASPRLQHQELFMKLAQAFWERYVDCVLSRAHGLGRRRSALSEAQRQLLLKGHVSL